MSAPHITTPGDINLLSCVCASLPRRNNWAPHAQPPEHGEVMTRPLKSTLLAALVGAVTATLLAAYGAPATRPGGDDPPARTAVGTTKVIVLADGGTAASRARVAALGGTVTRDLPIVGGFAAALPADAVAGLRRDPGVRSVTPDSTVRVTAAPLAKLSTMSSPSEPTSVYTKA